MFVGASRMSPFCFASADVVPGASRPFASDTPLRTDRYPAAVQIANSTTSARMTTSVQRFHVHRLRCRRALPSAGVGGSWPSRPGSGTLPFCRPPL